MLFKRFRRHREPQPQPQPQSFLFKLPLELRFEIYIYVFASSMLHEPEAAPLCTWDNLFLSCRQTKLEMESLPTSPIIHIVQRLWSDDFPNHPIDISASFKEGHTSEICVRMPRSVLGVGGVTTVWSSLPTRIFPLFRLLTDTFILSVDADGGNPLEPGYFEWGHIDYFYGLLREFILRKATRCKYRKRPPPCSRCFLNMTKLVITWKNTTLPLFDIGVPPKWWFPIMFDWPYNIGTIWGKPWRWGKFEKVGPKALYFHTVIWESKRRFR